MCECINFECQHLHNIEIDVGSVTLEDNEEHEWCFRLFSEIMMFLLLIKRMNFLYFFFTVFLS